MFLERPKIPAVMKQHEAFSYAEGRDDEIGRRPDGPTETSQRSVVFGGPDRDLVVEHSCDLECPQFAFEPRGMMLVFRALENFEQNEIADQYVFSGGFDLRLGTGIKSTLAAPKKI